MLRLLLLMSMVSLCRACEGEYNLDLRDGIRVMHRSYKPQNCWPERHLTALKDDDAVLVNQTLLSAKDHATLYYDCTADKAHSKLPAVVVCSRSEQKLDIVITPFFKTAIRIFANQPEANYQILSRDKTTVDIVFKQIPDHYCYNSTSLRRKLVDNLRVVSSVQMTPIVSVDPLHYNTFISIGQSVSVPRRADRAMSRDFSCQRRNLTTPRIGSRAVLDVYSDRYNLGPSKACLEGKVENGQVLATQLSMASRYEIKACCLDGCAVPFVLRIQAPPTDVVRVMVIELTHGHSDHGERPQRPCQPRDWIVQVELTHQPNTSLKVFIVKSHKQWNVWTVASRDVEYVTEAFSDDNGWLINPLLNYYTISADVKQADYVYIPGNGFRPKLALESKYLPGSIAMRNTITAATKCSRQELFIELHDTFKRKDYLLVVGGRKSGKECRLLGLTMLLDTNTCGIEITPDSVLRFTLRVYHNPSMTTTPKGELLRTFKLECYIQADFRPRFMVKSEEPEKLGVLRISLWVMVVLIIAGFVLGLLLPAFFWYTYKRTRSGQSSGEKRPYGFRCNSPDSTKELFSSLGGPHELEDSRGRSDEISY